MILKKKYTYIIKKINNLKKNDFNEIKKNDFAIY